MNAVVRGALAAEEAMAAPITTARDPVATVSKAARRRAEWRLLAWAACVLFGLRGGVSREIGERGGRRVGRVRSGENWRRG
jgi:hypothetical protein